MDEKKQEALRKWYAQQWILDDIQKSYDRKEWEDVEAMIQRNVLFPISKHSSLPDFMLDEDGKPLFPTNLNPTKDEEGWQDAIEIGWEVIEKELGIRMEEVQGEIAKEQKADWKVFMKSVEERKKKKNT